jgi:hypothetical protein
MNHTELGAHDSRWWSGLVRAGGPHGLREALQAEHDALAVANLRSLAWLRRATLGTDRNCRYHSVIARLASAQRMAEDPRQQLSTTPAQPLKRGSVAAERECNAFAGERRDIDEKFTRRYP